MFARSICHTLIFIRQVVNINHFSADTHTQKRFLRYNWSENPGRGGEEAGAAADRLIGIIAQITGTLAAEIGEESYLVADLGLTSIARLELVNYLEQEFRLDLEDSLIGPSSSL